MKKNKKISKNEGITLIALVVTIVVLLILAGVSLNLVLGNNGIITKAKEATRKTEEAKVAEELNMKMMESYIDIYSDGKLNPDVFNQFGVVGINKLLINPDTNSINAFVVIEKSGKYYNANLNVNQSDTAFDNIQQIASIPDEALVFYKCINNDEEVSTLIDGVYKYNNRIYSITGDVEDTGLSIYMQIAEPLKMRVNSGEYGAVALPVYGFVEWGDGTNSKKIEYSDIQSSVKLADINSEIKLADLPYYNQDHVYSSMNTEYVVSIYGIIGRVDSRICQSYADQILAIEDWGNCTRLNNLYLGYCQNLRTVASPGEQTFRYMESFHESFKYCESLQNIPENFFNNCPYVTDFEYTFYGCTSLTGNAPALWQRVPNGSENGYKGTPKGRNCFSDCTQLENYAEIPVYWKNSPE